MALMSETKSVLTLDGAWCQILDEFSDKLETIDVYTDGACQQTGFKKNSHVPTTTKRGIPIGWVGGFGVIFVLNGQHKLTVRGHRAKTTNQEMELYAIYVAMVCCSRFHKWYNNRIHTGAKRKSVSDKPEFRIHTDSAYSVSCITKWIEEWKTNNWKNSKGNPVAHKSLIQKIHLLERKYKPQIHKVAAHSGHAWNDKADEEAKNGQNSEPSLSFHLVKTTKEESSCSL